MDANNKTVNIAIIEDDAESAARLVSMLDRYGTENGLIMNKRSFGFSTEFLDTYNAGYDIVFMDIVLPDMDGMTAAKKLRETDKSVVLVFVTNMSQYAINGYEVGAADFIVKPFEYEHFAVKMQRIIGRLNIHDVIIPVKTADAVISIAASDLKYVEVRGHELIYHTTHGNYSSYGSLSKAERRLEEMRFVRCNSYYLVNPRYVESIGNNTAVVGGETLSISYAKRKEFRKAVVEYLGGLV